MKPSRYWRYNDQTKKHEPISEEEWQGPKIKGRKDHMTQPTHKIKEGLLYPDRGTTIVEVPKVFEECDSEIEINLADAIGLLTQAWEAVPDVYRHTAVFRITASDDLANVELLYERPETEDEMAARKQWLHQAQEVYDATAWRPIDTAPICGYIEIWDGRGAVCPVHWNYPRNSWMDISNCEVTATHWRPLPKGPK